MLKLKCAVQNYAWGKTGRESEVAKLYSSGNDNAPVEEDKPYAELWMGTHPSGPSHLSGEAESSSPPTTLKSWISENEASLGPVLLSKYGKDLPFLFKVLSVQTALSIQAHPHKSLAEKLHSERPTVYKDDNHKPEMTLALTEFEALSCFVSFGELHQAITQVPELAQCIGEAEEKGKVAQALSAEAAGADATKQQEALKVAFESVMKQDSAVVGKLIGELVDRLGKKGEESLTEKERLILRLNTQYPGDVGIFAAYFLNYITLQPGEAIYLEANEPHAYLSGNCVEVMATSDNVVRAGLTPKLRDTDVLCSMLTYKTGMPEILKGSKVSEHMKAYKPPFDEFQINVLSLEQSKQKALVKSSEIQGPLLVLVYEGEGDMASSSSTATANTTSSRIAKGNVFFVPDGQDLSIEAGQNTGCTLYIASANSRIF
jgi:mannose-6-phosphate isomerase